MRDRARLQDQLIRQLQYMHRSCALFDLGYPEEAIRIATAIRVLVHDGPRSRKGEGSLLRLLDAEGASLVTTLKPQPPDPRLLMSDGFVLVPGNIRPWKDYLLVPPLELPIAEWWTQPIFVVNREPITRRDLVLGAANKDGGAHVDKHLSPGYVTAMNLWEMKDVPLSMNHFFALRRIGLEVLSSADLYRLANIPDLEREDPTKLYRAASRHIPIMDRVVDVCRESDRGSALAEMGRHSDSIAPFDVALQLIEQIRVSLLLKSGIERLKAERYSEAESLYDAALVVEPRNIHALYGSGFTKSTLGKCEEALDLLGRATTQDPTFIPAHQSLAVLHLRMANPEAALAILEHILSIDPGNVLAVERRSAALKIRAGEALEETDNSERA
jgi:hypothetical protein